jgi:preprotein translocase subunit SecD
MTITQAQRPADIDPTPLVDAPVQDTELLFHEARQRRRKRWLVSGLAATAVAVVILVAALGLSSARSAGRPTASPSLPPAAGGTSSPRAKLSFRPVLCYAAPLTLAAGQSPSTGALPSCGSYQLTATNLDVQPAAGAVAGFTSSNVPADPQFAAYPSTAPGHDHPNGTVLLSGAPPPGGSGTQRYVLGPAGLTQTAIQSASTQDVGGQWVVNLALTGKGAAQWDNLAQSEFHEIIGIDLNGRVISAPIIQPVQSSFSSFGGHVQISGNFTQHSAKAIAAEL